VAEERTQLWWPVRNSCGWKSEEILTRRKAICMSSRKLSIVVSAELQPSGMEQCSQILFIKMHEIIVLPSSVEADIIKEF